MVRANPTERGDRSKETDKGMADSRGKDRVGGSRVNAPQQNLVRATHTTHSLSGGSASSLVVVLLRIKKEA